MTPLLLPGFTSAAADISGSQYFDGFQGSRCVQKRSKAMQSNRISRKWALLTQTSTCLNNNDLRQKWEERAPAATCSQQKRQVQSHARDGLFGNNLLQLAHVTCQGCAVGNKTHRLHARDGLWAKISLQLTHVTC